MNAIYAAWLVLSFTCFLYAARVWIADLREHGTGREWADCRCLDCLDGKPCEVAS